MDDLLKELLQDVPHVTLILAACALAVTGAVFALFLRPRLKKLDETVEDYAAFKAQLKALKLPENLNAFQAAVTDIAVLKQSEGERNQRLNEAIQGQSQAIAKVEIQIAEKVARGDDENLVRLLEVKVDHLETGYTLSKIVGGTREEEMKDRWNRAKNELAQAKQNITSGKRLSQ